MYDFSCHLPDEIVFGEGKVSTVAEHIKPHGKKCFVAVDPFFIGSGILDNITSLLKKAGIEPIIFSKIKSNPDCRDVDKGARLCKGEGCSSVLAIGGGSAIDLGKAVAVVVLNGGKSWDYVYKSTREAHHIENVLPIITVPTTAGTGTEATHFAVLSNPEVNEKGTIVNKKLFPKIAVVDPELMETMPPALTALTGIDALAHCIEAFLANSGSPFSSIIAKEGIKTIIQALPEAYSNGHNKRSRADMAWGSVLGGIAIGHASVGLPHAMGQPVGGLFDMPHGASVAACLTTSIEFAYMSSFELFAELATCFDESVKNIPLYKRAESSVDLIKRFFGYIDCAVCFGDVGMTDSDIEKATEVVFSGYNDNVMNFPRIATPEEVKMLYRRCLSC